MPFLPPNQQRQSAEGNMYIYFVENVVQCCYMQWFAMFAVSPCESGIVDVQPSPRIKRGLTLMCKIMQNIANHVLFTKELHMRPFNDFLKTNFDAARRFVVFDVPTGAVPAIKPEATAVG